MEHWSIEREKNLWWAFIKLRTSYALGVFKIPNEELNIPGILQQYEELRLEFKDKNKTFKKRNHLHRDTMATKESRLFFETSHFDEIMFMLGDNLYKTRDSLLNLIQLSISYEKKLFDEFCEQGTLI